MNEEYEEYNALHLLEEAAKKDKKYQRKVKRYKIKRFFEKYKIPIFILCFLFIGILAYFTAPAITYITYNINTKISTKNNYEKPKPKGYVNDTNYNGFNPECYDYPFQRTAQYTPNKELELSSDKSELYMTFGKKCIDKLFNIGYYTLMRQDDTILADELQDIYSSELLIIKGEEIPFIDYARELRNNFIENGITIKANLLTDESLIWQDNICQGSSRMDSLRIQ